jgi:hypothetical protein
MNKKFKITLFGYTYMAILAAAIIFLIINNIAPLPQPPTDYKGDKTLFNATTSRDYRNIFIPFGAIVVSISTSFFQVLFGYYQQVKASKK